jgi:hypothetical protein
MIIMSNGIVITREQQRDLHNARCYFHQFEERYGDILGQRVIDDFRRAYKLLCSAHDPILDEETSRWDRRNEHFTKVQREHRFKTVWSIYDIERLDEALPSKYLDITHVQYYNQLVAVERRDGTTGFDWLDLWIAAEKAINQSNDSHHIFVEGFYREDSDPVGVYRLTTGS